MNYTMSKRKIEKENVIKFIAELEIEE